MNNVKELQQSLSDLYSSVKSDSIDPRKAEVMTNIAGKMIAAAAVQVKYYAMRKEKPRIAFLSTRGNSDEQV